MKDFQINKYRWGFCISFTRNIFFNMDINEWHFIPSIEFYRRPEFAYIFKVAFLCFSLAIYRWRK
jgi:hypothetical protein